MLFYMIDILRAAQSCLQLYSLEPSKAPPQEAHKPPSLQPRALQGTGRGLYGQALKNPLSLLAACPELNTTTTRCRRCLRSWSRLRLELCSVDLARL
jgi:hypothetical protein